MCLNTVSHRFKQPPLAKIVKAFKIFELPYHGSKTFRLPVMTHSTPDFVEKKWYSARNRVKSVRTTPKSNYNYVRGFHAFATRAAALKAKRTNFAYNSRTVVREVKLQGVHTKGTQYGVPCLVANKLYIPSLDKVKRAKTSAKRRASGKR
jgi:hypothetical protein